MRRQGFALGVIRRKSSGALAAPAAPGGVSNARKQSGALVGARESADYVASGAWLVVKGGIDIANAATAWYASDWLNKHCAPLMVLPSNERCYQRLVAEPDSEAARQFAYLKRFSDERGLLERGFDANVEPQFHELYWELYLAAALNRFGLAVTRGTGNCEPDFRVNSKGATIFIEAVASSSPTSPENQVRPPSASAESDFEDGIAPDAAILQRLAQCIDEKIGKLNRPATLATMAAAGDSCVVIALNGNRAVNGHPHDDIPIAVPFVVRAVFGLVDQRSNSRDGVFWRQSATMQKGARTFPVGHFDQDQWRIRSGPGNSVRHIAGVLFSKAMAWHTAGQLGDDFLFVQNPHGPDLTNVFRFCPRGVWIRDHEIVRKIQV